MLTSRENPSPLSTVNRFSRAFCARSVEWQVFFKVQVLTCIRFEVKRTVLRYSPINGHILLADGWSTTVVKGLQHNRRWTEYFLNFLNVLSWNNKRRIQFSKKTTLISIQRCSCILYMFFALPPLVVFFILAKTLLLRTWYASLYIDL